MMTVSITINKTRHSAWWQYYYAERLKLALSAECRGAKLKALNGLKISIHFDESNQRPLVILDIWQNNLFFLETDWILFLPNFAINWQERRQSS
jgi:hypothetical protein